MATVRTSIQLTNGMTPALRQMANSLNMVLSSFEAVQRASSETVDVSAIQAARAELNKAEITFNEIEQEIREADQAQQQFNSDVRNGQGAAAGLFSQFKRVVGVLGMGFGVKQLVGVSDEMVSITARLNLMNDGLQTTAELQDMIYNSAQRARASYVDTAQVVSKLGILAGDAFGSNEEMVAFSELMNKQFKIGGASIQEQTAAMYQLTQAMAAGRLQGDEFRSIMENAPMLAQSIAEHMSMTTGELREMSREGLITADVIKNAMFASADETNAKFAELPMTWGQVWTSIVNRVLMYSEPLLGFISLLANNWGTLEPIVLGLAAAVGIYATMMGVQAAATWLADQEHRKLIATMLANPFLWVALVIGILIALIYKWVNAVGGISNAWILARNNVLNIVGDMKVGVLSLLQSMLNGAIDKINDFINHLNKIPGLSFSLIQELTFATEAKLEHREMKKRRQVEINAIREGIDNKADTGFSFDYDSMMSNVASIADYTGQMADSLDVSEEDLKYLRDLAEREVIDRTVLRDVRIDFSNTFGDIRETADVDGIISRFEEKLEEALFSESEGVFNNV